MVTRLVSGILAVTFLPLGIVFVIIGLTVDKPYRGDPAVFVYLGAIFTVAGAALAIVFLMSQRREAERRRRRRAGLRATVEVLRSQINPNIRSGSRLALDLTVRFPGRGDLSTRILADPNEAPAAGTQLEILYDPAEPANFEPVL